MTTAPKPASHYRPDIDGLRAVAVVFVVIYHFKPALFPSGYVGVDIFFVISGYVVTTSALAQATGRAIRDIANFWVRRIKRIIPLLITVVGCTAVLYALVVPPFPVTVYNATFRTAITALFGLSNIYMLRTSSDYFLQDTTLNPLLHTWSLGVEEQFYVLFALAILAFPFFLKAKAHKTKYRKTFLVLVILTSFGLAAFSDLPAITKFYAPHTRLWEIACGSLLAVWRPNGLPCLADAGIRPSFITIGRLVLLTCICLVGALPHGQDNSLPVALLLSVLASISLIALVPPPHDRQDLLSYPAFVYIGQRSYGIYLWHWPVFFFIDRTIGVDNMAGVIFSSLFILGLSVLTYRFVECPIRYSRLGKRKIVSSIGAGLALLVVILAFFQMKPGIIYVGAPYDWNGEWMPRPQNAYLAGGKITARDCHLSSPLGVPSQVPANCSSAGDSPNVGGSDRKRIFVVGDSHAYSDWAMLAYAHDHGHVALTAFSLDGCALPGPGIPTTPVCKQYWQKVPSYMRSVLRAGDTLFVSANWKGYGNVKNADKAFREILDAALGMRVNVVIESPLPYFVRQTTLCTPEWYRTNYEGCSANREQLLHALRPSTAYLNELASSYKNILIWDAFPYLCSGEACHQFYGDKPLFRDPNHLAYWGSNWLGPNFVQFLSANSLN